MEISPGRRSSSNAAGLDVTVTVSTLARLPFAGNVPEAGVNAQEIPAGAAGQLNENWSEYRF